MNKIGFTRGQIRVHAIALLMVFCTGIYLYSAWGTVPAQIVTHYGPAGLPDGWSDKSVLIALVVISAGIWAFLAFAGLLQIRFPYAPASTTPEGQAFDRENAHWVLCSANLFVTACFSYIIWSSASGKTLGKWVVPLLLLLLFASLIVLIVRARRGVSRFE